MGGGYCEVRRGGVGVGREAGGGVFVEEYQVGVCEGVVDVGPPISSSGIGGLRVPGGMVGVEVSHDNGIIMGVEESVKGGGEGGRARGVWRDVDIIDVDGY